MEEKIFSDKYEKSKVISVQEYLEGLEQDARPARNSFQRVTDMIFEAGVEKYEEFGDKLLRYKFFSSLDESGNYTEDSIFGLERNLMKLVKHFKAAAYGYGAQQRIILLHGPVGSSKSTIARLLKRGFEIESEKHPLYAFRFVNLGSFHDRKNAVVVDSPMYGKVKLFDQVCQLHEDPIRLLMGNKKKELIKKINEANKDNENMKYPVRVEGGLCPHCKFNLELLLHHYKGDWDKVMEEHVKVYRLYLSEDDRVGIGTFDPKDEKSQDSTDLTGNIDYRKIAIFGSDADPRAFNFDGELCVANRGIIEFIEMLKLERTFLYDLLSVSQEHKMKPKKFRMVDVDEIVLGHTNEEEFRKLQEDVLQKALRDRTKRFDIPYNLKLINETKIYEKTFNKTSVSQCHIAPHTLEMPAMWAILTRLEGPKGEATGTLNLLQKLDLYNGKDLPGIGESKVKDLMAEAKREGLDGISPRIVQDSIGDAIAGHDIACVNPFMVMKEIKDKLKYASVIEKEEIATEYGALLKEVENKLEEILQDEVQRAIASDDRAIKELFNKYITNVKAYKKKGSIKDLVTGRDKEPDENLMRSVEEKIAVSDSTKDEFRGHILEFIGGYAIEKKPFDVESNPELHKAITQKLYEDQKDSIKLDNIFNEVVDDEEQEKIDILKKRMKDSFGYCEICSTDALNFVAGIIAREKEKERGN